MFRHSFCCDAENSSDVEKAEIENCSKDFLTCCTLVPVEYNFNVFSQGLVPIYGCESQSGYLDNLSRNGDRNSSNKVVDDIDLNIDYSKLYFPNEIWYVRETWEIAVKTAAVIPLVIIAILGNLVIMKVVLSKKAMRKNPVNLFICNVAIADLLCTLLFPWIFLISDFYQRFVLGPFICKVEGFVLVTLMLSSVFTLTVISVDRLVAVVFPFNCRIKPKTAKWIIVAIWILACGISSPLIIYRSYKERQWLDFHETWCTEDIQKLEPYWLGLIIVLVWIPLTILTICYTGIVIKLDTLEKRQKNQPITQIKSKSKIIRMLFLVVLVFSICWIPFTVMIFIRNNLHDTPEDVEVTDWFRTLFFVSHYLMFVNCAVNPIIYGLLNDNFKRELRSQGVPPCCKRQTKVEVSTVLPNGRIGGVQHNQGKNTEKTKWEKAAEKYGLVFSTTSTSSTMPNLNALYRRDSALRDLGIPVAEPKSDSLCPTKF